MFAAGDVAALGEQIDKAKAKWELSANTPVVSCYEAGRDGFWLHRQLTELGIDNRVVDAASIEVSRRARRAKTDRLDARALQEKLIRYEGGDRRFFACVIGIRKSYEPPARSRGCCYYNRHRRRLFRWPHAPILHRGRYCGFFGL